MARVCVSVSYENRNYRDYEIAEKGTPKTRGECWGRGDGGWSTSPRNSFASEGNWYRLTGNGQLVESEASVNLGGFGLAIEETAVAEMGIRDKVFFEGIIANKLEELKWFVRVTGV